MTGKSSPSSVPSEGELVALGARDEDDAGGLVLDEALEEGRPVPR